MARPGFPDLDTITNALADDIETQVEIQTYDYIPDGLHPPCAVIDVLELNQLDFGSWNLTVEIVLVVSSVVDSEATRERNRLIDPIRAAADAFRIDGVVCDSVVTTLEMEKRINVAAATFTGATFTVEMITV